MKNSLTELYTLIQVLSVTFVTSTRLSDYNETEVLLSKTFTAIRSALDFIDRQHRNVNLDTIIGTRILEGQFKVFLHQIERSDNAWNVDRDDLREINSLRLDSAKISKRSIPYIATFTPQYYNKIGLMLAKGFWEQDYESRDFPSTVNVWKFRPGEALHEEDSDNCIAEFFGTGKRTHRECVITDQCWKRMTSPLYNGYSLSHELFYLQIGKQFGCEKEMEVKRLVHKQKSIDDMEANFCANMLNEAIVIAQSGYQEDRQDLFMEQAALCGMMGYREFFTSDWLKKILSWQDKELGCYKGVPVYGSEVEYRGEDNHIRKKREERPLVDGCMCHRTTVALAALGQYVRYMVEYKASLFELLKN